MSRLSELSPGVLFAILIGVGLSVLGFVFFYIPSWQMLLGWSGFWTTVLAVVVVAGVLSKINVPIGVRTRDHTHGINLLGVGGPIAVIVYAYGDIAPTLRVSYAVPWGLALCGYIWNTRACGLGVLVRGSAITFLGLGLVLYFRYVGGLPTRDVMWWSFTCQFTALLIPDVYRGYADSGEIARQTRELVQRLRGSTEVSAELVEVLSRWPQRMNLGGAGMNDALWKAPVSALSFTYLFHLLFWS